MAGTPPPGDAARPLAADRHELPRLASVAGYREDWLVEALPPLEAAEERCVLAGDDLVHNDVWAGNVCFVDGRVVLVDWSVAACGNRWFDVALALVSIRAEHGPPVQIEIPGLTELLALIAGHHAVRVVAGLPDWARDDSALLEGHRIDLDVALRWAAERLGLPAPT